MTRPSRRFKDEANLQEFESFLVEMKGHGYNVALFSGSEIFSLHKFNVAAKNRFHQMLAKAEQQEIAIIPMSNGQRLPNGTGDPFSEAFPTRGTPFRVTGNKAFVNSAPVPVKNKGFEEPIGTGWKGNLFVRDTAVKYSGNSSVRIDNPAKLSVLIQTVPLVPNRTYELSIRVKLSEDISDFSNIGFWVIQGGHILLKKRDGYRNNIPYSHPGKGWFLHKDILHSRSYSSAQVFIVTSEFKPLTGTIWFDAFEMREVGLHDVVRRPSLPIQVKSSESGKVYTEGDDYNIGYRRINIPAGSSISDGEELKVDWFTAATPNTTDPPAAFCGQQVWDLVRQTVDLEDEWFKTPPARFMTYSEWRVAGWDPACIQEYGIDKVGSGPYMGMVAAKTKDLYRRANSNRIVLGWSDDFDPYHNAKKAHDAINGGSFGAWTHLKNDMVIMNWKTEKPAGSRKNSVRFFAGLNKTNWEGYGVKTGHQKQIISCGRWGPGVWGDWLSILEDLEKNEGLSDTSVIGVNFHTFNGDYTNVGAMAQFYKDAGRWGTGPVDFPDAGIEKAPPKTWRGAASLQVSRQSGHLRSLQFNVQENKGVRLSVYNLRGQAVSNILNEKMAVGAYERKLDTSEMAPGVYFVRLNVVGRSVQQVTRKMVVF